MTDAPFLREQVQSCVEPRLDCPYLLFRPARYDRGSSWPLVVVCPASPWDSPSAQMRRWSALAESHGFLVAIPRLTSTRALPGRSLEAQLQSQRDDDVRILAVVRHVRGGSNVSEDRIFIHGTKGGAYAALFTGLGHPEVFRGVSVASPRFDARFLAPVMPRIDPHQPVFVHFPMTDAILGRRGRTCAEWVRRFVGGVIEDHGLRSGGGVEARVAGFMTHVIAALPWARVRAFAQTPQDPLEARFVMRCSFVPATYWWDFGDGSTSTVASPIHRFPEPGTYVVSVAVTPTGARTPIRRTLQLKVPDALVPTPSD